MSDIAKQIIQPLNHAYGHTHQIAIGAQDMESGSGLDDDDAGLTDGQVAGIVIGTVLGVAAIIAIVLIIILIIYCCCFR